MNPHTILRHAPHAATLLLLPAVAQAQFAITWSTIDAGGVTTPVVGGPYALAGTPGQPDAHPAFAAPALAVTGGFWAASSIPGQSCGPVDFNHDGNLDPDDLSDYIACYFGHFSGQPCPAADYNGDTNIDPDDLSDYIAAYFGGCP